MTGRTIFIVVGLVVALGLVFFVAKKFDQNGYPLSDVASSSPVSLWSSFSDAARGVAYKYPESLPTKYIRAVDWPPQLAVGDGPYECTKAGSTTARAGQTEERAINGRLYCVTTVTDGAAGSIYNQYAYATMKDNKLEILTFTTGAPQCGNYEEPNKSECEAERASFNLDNLVAQIFGTVVLSTPTMIFEKG